GGPYSRFVSHPGIRGAGEIGRRVRASSESRESNKSAGPAIASPAHTQKTPLGLGFFAVPPAGAVPLGWVCGDVEAERQLRAYRQHGPERLRRVVAGPKNQDWRPSAR